MATKRQSIKAGALGASVLLFISAVILISLLSLWLFSLEHSEISFYIDDYLWHVIAFTFTQAVFSTILSLFFALIFAKSLYQSCFKYKHVIIKLLSITFVLPSLVVVIGLISIYGNQGLISQICRYFGIYYDASIYGINGILLAHVFLNFPFATKYFYKSLMLIPNEQKQLCEQLRLTYFYVFKYLEWPVLYKQLLPLGGLIFMLCFSSFSIVLALGGSPKYTTIEVAIYQAVRDFEFEQAVMLSIIQILFCFSFMILLKRLEPKYDTKTKTSHSYYHLSVSNKYKNIGYAVIFVSTLFILLPLISIFIDGVINVSYDYFNSALLTSLTTSLSIAFLSALLAMILGISILWSYSRLKLIRHNKISELYLMLGSFILAVPSIVLSSGLFILCLQLGLQTHLTFILVVISNSLLALPFILKQMANPLYTLTKQHYFLSQSIGLSLFNHLYWIDFKALKKLFLYCFAFALVMSLGDFGIVALFGGQDFMTLPYYLYDCIAHYRYKEAAFVALILLVIVYGLITVFEGESDDHV